ncbi:MAG: riboflavin biosynthesis protein RibF [Candidatus Omnitrophota bacterium]
MKILYGYRDLQKELRDPIVAIGVFDGIHIGHMRVINRVLSFRSPARDRAIVTFDPHPQEVLCSGRRPPRIMSLEHRLSIFEKMKLDAVIILRFTPFIAQMSPEEFVKRVLGGIGTRTVYVGNNFYFGRGRRGNVNVFRKIGRAHGIDIKTVQPVKKKGKIVSSTWLRGLISKGKIDRARELLRRPVSVLGTVVRGDRRGSGFGVPTANIDPHHEVVPPPGVYAVKVDTGTGLFDGVLNIGFRPTFYGRKLRKRKEPWIEVHIINFRGNIYGHLLEIFFIKRLRREKKFRNEKALKLQIEADLRHTREVLEGNRAVRKIGKYRTRS